MFTHTRIELSQINEAHRDGKHFYICDGMTYPSITTILHSFPNPGIEKWKYNTANWQEIQQESMSVGTELHKKIEEYLKGKDIQASNLVETLFQNMTPQLNKINNIKCQEARMFEPNLKIAGTVDCIAEYDGVLSVIDFKNSRKKKYESVVKKSGYYEQLNAYARMFQHMTGTKISQGVVLISAWDNKVTEHIINIDDYNDNLDFILEQYYTPRAY